MQYNKEYIPQEGEITVNLEPREGKYFDPYTGKPEKTFTGKIFVNGEYFWLNLTEKTYKSGKNEGKKYLKGKIGKPVGESGEFMPQTKQEEDTLKNEEPVSIDDVFLN